MSAWTRAEVAAFVEQQLAGWSTAAQAAWRRYAVVPFTVPWHRVSCQLGGDEIFVLARASDAVLVYDCVEAEFAVGRLDEFGILRDFRGNDAQLERVQRRFVEALAGVGAP